MKQTEKNHRLLLHPEDLHVNQLVTIHHWRDGREWGLGYAFKITAINLPYVVVESPNQTKTLPTPLDVRRLTFMAITPEYAEALAKAVPIASMEDDLPF